MGAPADLEAQIKRIIVERLFLEIDAVELESAASLTETYGVDSVRLFDMVVGMEDVFGISFEDEELALDNFDTVTAIAARVRAKMGE